MQRLAQETRRAQFQRSRHGESNVLDAAVQEQILEPPADRLLG